MDSIPIILLIYLALVSFNKKVLGCYGDGGAIFTDNKILSDKIKIRSHGSINKKNYDIQGVSGRMDTLQRQLF